MHFWDATWISRVKVRNLKNIDKAKLAKMETPSSSETGKQPMIWLVLGRWMDGGLLLGTYASSLTLGKNCRSVGYRMLLGGW